MAQEIIVEAVLAEGPDIMLQCLGKAVIIRPVTISDSYPMGVAEGVQIDLSISEAEKLHELLGTAIDTANEYLNRLPSKL